MEAIVCVVIEFCVSLQWLMIKTANWHDCYNTKTAKYETGFCSLPASCCSFPGSNAIVGVRRGAFWTGEAQVWTQMKAWNGEDFPKDHRW